MGPETRAESIEALQRETFDLVVIGGGATGAGAALDAASRGLKTALIEKGDFASGTSSKSSKLIHGGLRYLAQYMFGLTWEAAHERDLLRRLAPHLVRPIRFLYPVFREGKELKFAPLGLTFYDVFASLRNSPRHRRAGPQQIADLAPRIDPTRVKGAWTYWDAVTDDSRLVFEIVRSAHAFGGTVANYVRTDGFDKAGPRAGAVRVTDLIGDKCFEVKGRAFLNATGIWAQEVGSLADPSSTPKLRPAKGIHLVVPADRVPLGAACIVPSGARDRRSLFAMPWGGAVMLGTTDTDYSGPLDRPAVTKEDVSYVLDGINASMDIDLVAGDVIGGWAGLRPLLDAASDRTADLSRKHAIVAGDSGVVTITGGKLTTYRRMAADAVDVVARRLGIRAQSRTRSLRLGISRPVEAIVADVAELARRLGADEDIAAGLVASYGDLAPSVLELAADDPSLVAAVAPGVIGAQIVWAARNEMAMTLDDALSRRTRLALTERSGGLASTAPGIMSRAAGWGGGRTGVEAAAYAERLAAERGPVPLAAVIGA
jgi:glycerol-3-phosphate dehydrogenase